MPLIEVIIFKPDLRDRREDFEEEDVNLSQAKCKLINFACKFNATIESPSKHLGHISTFYLKLLCVSYGA